MDKYIDLAEDNILKTYNRFPVVFKKGEDVYLYDNKDKKYLDFLSGIGVIGLGYSNKKFTDSIKEQVENLLHTSNLFYTEEIGTAASKIIEVSKMSKVFFTNSGAEAIEGALKVAKKFAYEKNGKDDYEIIAFKNSFHGRTIGALSVTGNDSYREPFYPLLPGVKFAEINNISSVKELINTKTAAIIIEPIQGEGGLTVADDDFLKELESICNEKNILLILDEIQCGVGRTGSFYRYLEIGIKPDIVTTAKAIGNGIPVGAFLLNEKAAKDSLKPGDHGTTYGGNPLAGKAISTVIDIFKEDEILKKVKSTSLYFEEKLDELVNKYDFILEKKGIGLMRGLKLSSDKKVGDIVKNCLNNGLVIGTAEGNVLRFLPPLIIDNNNIDEMIGKLEKSF
ncbi:aspartate aminotransferase family protein [Miniphocaeibacter halophilus]|uniref:Aspartate aminotransferase family protein n=1 Tax=Miniphocaeibacter halophilus TaxID=2931922 RepID=A0AC61N2J6_9FIRM|nr:aspartate aminotransferase family protein [Miniphocaeibacter halophilus]QQK07793.1 aspartate aminotransferase family protein [Miniphocaeibacter halophilus]